MSSFSIPLTGLNAASTELNTIANNLSNMNTTAFKSQNVNFSDLFYQQIGTTGSGDPLQVGAGTQVASTGTDFTPGGIDETGNPDNVFINGNGFFVVQGGGGAQELTRDGDFITNGGYLMTQNGDSVMGYSANNGVVNTNAPIAPIQLPVGAVEQAKATGNVSMTANLNASDATGTTVNGQVQVYDSLGDPHEATVYFTKTGTNTWGYSMSLDPSTVTGSSATSGGATTYTYNLGAGASVDPSTNLTISGTNGSGTSVTTTAPAIAPGESLTTYATALQSALTAAGLTGTTVTASGASLTIAGTGISTGGNLLQSAAATASSNAAGQLTFDANGNLLSPSSNVSGIQLGGLSDGAADLSITWDLFGSNGSGLVTQTAAGSSTSGTVVSATTQDGYASGSYNGFSIDSSGVISATYSNGKTQVIGQMALATVANEQGLKIGSGNNYIVTTASGSPTTGVAGSSGLGTLEDDALENSNVNISTQFSNLIVAQQAFDASSKAITTFDNVSQETINMIH